MTSGPSAWACRTNALASGTLPAPTRVNWRYTRLARTSHSTSSKLQPRTCFSTSIRKTTSAGVPYRPRVLLLGWRRVKASYTMVTNCSSSSTWSACRIQPCHQLPTCSARKPSSKSGGRLRALITALDGFGTRRGFRAQGELIELANRLQDLLHLAEIFEPQPHLRQLVAMQADLTILAAWIVDVEDPLGMTAAAGAGGATAGVEGGAMEQRTAQDFGKGGESGEEAAEYRVFLCHPYR